MQDHLSEGPRVSGYRQREGDVPKEKTEEKIYLHLEIVYFTRRGERDASYNDPLISMTTLTCGIPNQKTW